MPTFADAARTVWKQWRPGWRSPLHARLWLGSLERHVLPHIGKMPIAEVTSADVIGILAPIWHEKAPTARKLRQRIRAVLEWAVAMDLRPDNPCDRIGSVLGAQGKAVRHMRALPHGEVASALRTVRASNTRPVVKLAFEFLVLTATRSGEVHGAAWTETGRRECGPFRPHGRKEIGSTGFRSVAVRWRSSRRRKCSVGATGSFFQGWAESQSGTRPCRNCSGR